MDKLVDGAANYAEKMTYRYRNRDERDRFTTLPSNWLINRKWEDESSKSLHADVANYRPPKLFTNRHRKSQQQPQRQPVQEVTLEESLGEAWNDFHNDVDVDAMCTEHLTKLSKLF
jgi:hypothetical protein